MASQQGEPGTPGITGATGTPGATGATGASGATGAAGAEGHAGVAGMAGPVGPRGPEGGATPALSSTLAKLSDSIDRFAARQFVSNVVVGLMAIVVLILVVVVLQQRHAGAVHRSQSADVLRILAAVESVTGPDARAASATGTQVLIDGLVTSIRRSVDCAVLYANGDRPPACAEVYARLEALRAGDDPFARPTTTTTRP